MQIYLGWMDFLNMQSSILNFYDNAYIDTICIAANLVSAQIRDKADYFPGEPAILWDKVNCDAKEQFFLLTSNYPKFCEFPPYFVHQLSYKINFKHSLKYIPFAVHYTRAPWQTSRGL